MTLRDAYGEIFDACAEVAAKAEAAKPDLWLVLQHRDDGGAAVAKSRAEFLSMYREWDGDFPIIRVLHIKSDGTHSDETDAIRSEIYWRLDGFDRCEAREFNASCTEADRLAEYVA